MYLGKPHMDTLNKLYNMAKKHNCLITFSMEPIYEEAFDWELFAEQNKIDNDEIMQDLVDNLVAIRECTYGATYTFELFDETTREHKVLTYYDYTSYIQYEEPWGCSDDTVEVLDEHSTYSHGIELHSSDTKFYGWGDIDTKEFTVYRDGMMLKFFGDLVCDYLGEERIQEVY